MGSSPIILSTVVVVLCISMWTVVSSPVSNVQQSSAVVDHHLQRREIMFRPLFAYREQEIKKRRLQEARDDRRIDQQEYERQMQEYEKAMKEYREKYGECC
ncbi:uncharacterized protein LOC131692147 [Topomyia yanbarensis]|uniref:uncharacterized protein LOC131692147 n=1 Tax=Topomyia yanbarensis TaxID=2498891 RepID=UPI00273C2B27|nr:uncharacterized protein LOC131692147 [Topomyia yanbarensis]